MFRMASPNMTDASRPRDGHKVLPGRLPPILLLHGRMSREHAHEHMCSRAVLMPLRHARKGPLSEGAAPYLCASRRQTRRLLRAGCGPRGHRRSEPWRLEHQLPVVLTRCSVLSYGCLAEGPGSAAGCSVAGRGCHCDQEDLRSEPLVMLFRHTTCRPLLGMHDGWAMKLEYAGLGVASRGKVAL